MDAKRRGRRFAVAFQPCSTCSRFGRRQDRAALATAPRRWPRRPAAPVGRQCARLRLAAGGRRRSAALPVSSRKWSAQCRASGDRSRTGRGGYGHGLQRGIAGEQVSAKAGALRACARRCTSAAVGLGQRAAGVDAQRHPVAEIAGRLRDAVLRQAKVERGLARSRGQGPGASTASRRSPARPAGRSSGRRLPDRGPPWLRRPAAGRPGQASATRGAAPLRRGATAARASVSAAASAASGDGRRATPSVVGQTGVPDGRSAATGAPRRRHRPRPDRPGSLPAPCRARRCPAPPRRHRQAGPGRPPRSWAGSAGCSSRHGRAPAPARRFRRPSGEVEPCRRRGRSARAW